MSELVVVCNCPDAEVAERIALAVLEARLAACVNILGPCRSLYRWQGVIETAAEIPLLIKTTQACYAALETLIKDLHPYDVPEIIALNISQGLPAYLNWLHAETVEV